MSLAKMPKSSLWLSRLTCLTVLRQQLSAQPGALQPWLLPTQTSPMFPCLTLIPPFTPDLVLPCPNPSQLPSVFRKQNKVLPTPKEPREWFLNQESKGTPSPQGLLRYSSLPAYTFWIVSLLGASVKQYTLGSQSAKLHSVQLYTLGATPPHPSVLH